MTGEQFLDEFICCGDTNLAKESFIEILEMNLPEEGTNRKTIFREKHGEGIFLLIQYFMSHMNLIDHGSSVGGAWLRPEGQELLEELLTSPK